MQPSGLRREAGVQGSKVPKAGPEPRAGAAQRTEHGEDPSFEPRGGGSPKVMGYWGEGRSPQLRIKRTVVCAWFGCEVETQISKPCEWVPRGCDSPFGGIQSADGWSGFSGAGTPLMSMGAGRAKSHLRGIKQWYVCWLALGSIPRSSHSRGGCNGGAQRTPLPRCMVLPCTSYADMWPQTAPQNRVM